MLKGSLLAPAVAAAASGMIAHCSRHAGCRRDRRPASGRTNRRISATTSAGQTRRASACCSISAGVFISATRAMQPRTSDSAADDPATSRRRAASSRPAPSPSTTATGSRSICRTTGPSSCLSRTIRRSLSKGFYPLGRNYPATSVGWYRRVFELPAADAGKRISIEFDGAYRETMVVFNGFYIGRTAAATIPSVSTSPTSPIPAARNVLLVRVDATRERRLVLRGRGHLSPRLARQDQSRAREANGERFVASEIKLRPAQARPRFLSALK